MITSILLTGVGGQGILLSAGIIASAAEFVGHDVKTNEIHGMAQRGGSVTAQVRFGDKVFSPLALEGTVDVLAAMEHVEALRWAHFLKPDGLAAVARTTIVPVTATTGACRYPDDVEARLRAVFRNLRYEDCGKLAQEEGSAKLANVVLTGILSNALPDIPEEAWLAAVERRVKKEFVDADVRAFRKGRNLT